MRWGKAEQSQKKAMAAIGEQKNAISESEFCVPFNVIVQSGVRSLDPLAPGMVC